MGIDLKKYLKRTKTPTSKKNSKKIGSFSEKDKRIESQDLFRRVGLNKLSRQCRF